MGTNFSKTEDAIPQCTENRPLIAGVQEYKSGVATVFQFSDAQQKEIDKLFQTNPNPTLKDIKKSVQLASTKPARETAP